jgi:CDP-4-dehydro-6-deoxyglucose reductase
MTHTILLQPSGQTIVAEEGETVLDAALRAGQVLPYSCRNGSCGSCKGRIISGEVDYGRYDAAALTDAERAAGYALFCQAVPRGELVIEAQVLAAVADIPIKTLPCRVMRMERLAPDVMGLWLKLPQNQRLQFLAGQYIDILLKEGRRRSFSLANAPHDDEFLQLQIRHVPRGRFTSHVFGEMKEKDLLRFRGPFGTFYLREDSPLPIIMVAGGTGFAPMKSILEHMFHAGIDRPVYLYWGAKTKRDLYQADLVHQWARDHAQFRFVPVLSQADPADNWSGRTGWPHDAVLADHPDLGGFEVYASGPPAMIDAIRDHFMRHGLQAEHLHYDSFEFVKDAV